MQPLEEFCMCDADLCNEDCSCTGVSYKCNGASDIKAITVYTILLLLATIVILP